MDPSPSSLSKPSAAKEKGSLKPQKKKKPEPAPRRIKGAKPWSPPRGPQPAAAPPTKKKTVSAFDLVASGSRAPSASTAAQQLKTPEKPEQGPSTTTAALAISSAFAHVETASLVLRLQTSVLRASLEHKGKGSANLDDSYSYPNQVLWMTNDARRELVKALRAAKKLMRGRLDVEGAREMGGLTDALHGLSSANGQAGGRNSLEAHQFNFWLITGEILVHLARSDLLDWITAITHAINGAFPQRPGEIKGAPGQFDLDRRFRANSFGLLVEAVLFASSAVPGAMPSPAAITHCTHHHPPVSLEAETSPNLLDVMGVWVTLVESAVDRVRELLGLTSAGG